MAGDSGNDHEKAAAECLISLALFIVYPLEKVADFRHIFIAGSLIVDPEKTLGPVYA
jgi:hypothetical protein